MSLIEGIDDEVTVLAICFLVFAITVVVWASTHVNTAVAIIDRERFGELLQCIQGIAVRAHFAGENGTDVPSRLSAGAAESHSVPVADSLLVSNAAAGGIYDVQPQSSHDAGVDDLQSSDGEPTCLHRSESASSPDDTDSSLRCGSASTSKSNTNCSESALSFHNAATASFASDTPPNSIQVRLQFVDGRQRTVFANPDDTIGHFKRYVCTHVL